jgi:deaminated glutathione amidase
MQQGFPHRSLLVWTYVARAIENQCYVIAAAQYGRHNEKRVSYGHSLIVDGWGTVIADAGGMSSADKPNVRPSIVSCEIDLNTISSIRERMPIQQHRDRAQF